MSSGSGRSPGARGRSCARTSALRASLRDVRGGAGAAVRGAVADSEDEKNSVGAPQPTRFLVLGDGAVLWRSESIRAYGVRQDFNINVSNVRVLELRTFVENGNCTGSHAAWVDPYVTVK